MSRIGKVPVELKDGVTLEQNGETLLVKGPKGELTERLLPGFVLEQKEQRLELTIKNENPTTLQQYGLMRTLIANMVHGVAEGFEKKLEVNGVGFRINLQGSKLVMNLGFSHPIEFEVPEDTTLSIEQNIITISGISKQRVGQVAAQIRDYKKPEPYKGKGIRYIDEVVRRKAGKAAAKAGA